MEPRTSHLDEAKMIPWWSVALAIAVFIGWEIFMYQAAAKRPDPKPWSMIIFLNTLAGLFFAFQMLMVGYVNRDAKRRGMSARFWTIVMLLLMTSGLGFIIYFMLRQPIIMTCPKCVARVEPEFNFCPGCDYQLAAVCQNCQRQVRDGAIFCAYCGVDLDRSQTLAAIK